MEKLDAEYREATNKAQNLHQKLIQLQLNSSNSDLIMKTKYAHDNATKEEASLQSQWEVRKSAYQKEFDAYQKEVIQNLTAVVGEISIARMRTAKKISELGTGIASAVSAFEMFENENDVIIRSEIKKLKKVVKKNDKLFNREVTIENGEDELIVIKEQKGFIEISSDESDSDEIENASENKEIKQKNPLPPQKKINKINQQENKQEQKLEKIQPILIQKKKTDEPKSNNQKKVEINQNKELTNQRKKQENDKNAFLVSSKLELPEQQQLKKSSDVLMPLNAILLEQKSKLPEVKPLDQPEMKKFKQKAEEPKKVNHKFKPTNETIEVPIENKEIRNKIVDETDLLDQSFSGFVIEEKNSKLQKNNKHTTQEMKVERKNEKPVEQKEEKIEKVNDLKALAAAALVQKEEKTKENEPLVSEKLETEAPITGDKNENETVKTIDIKSIVIATLSDEHLSENIEKENSVIEQKKEDQKDNNKTIIDTKALAANILNKQSPEQKPMFDIKSLAAATLNQENKPVHDNLQQQPIPAFDIKSLAASTLNHTENVPNQEQQIAQKAQPAQKAKRQKRGRKGKR
ncbi:hypothetical protein TRFO_04902 [Tritrichomonas foetus]|uniref:Uncharacterized protein n=1 Tax=Tritrichomonas foetus TaxID=1144522 RepID=A0A1J4KG18_9EUKA|nr:hypothetical protein TRFO_04902 [Tritrichomonas foetus]|eukprot:OHT08293.1 hypothetical protein TRFO_04902 [Tritrichomonas foetus]